LWDDYRPVEYAHKDTVPVATYLSLFIGKDTEIQVSQSFNDGNLDVKWSRGVVFTTKQEGLWEPTARVSAEDVRHLRNRVGEFHFAHVVLSLKEVRSCAPCMARWVRKCSDDAIPALLPVAATPVATTSASDFSAVAGFRVIMVSANLAALVAEELFSDVVALGALDVIELSLSDWEQLPSWRKLRPLEARRLKAAAGPAGSAPHT
jgi:hypothetical protein